MKKMLFLVAVATLFFAACQQEINPASEQEKTNDLLTFKASIEQPKDVDTKGTINAENKLAWAENDLIGIYFPDWGDKNQPFRVAAEDAGKTEGNFTIATGANPSGASATAAYYPWEPEGSTTYPGDWQNNVWEGVIYFKLRDNYYGYDSGKMLTPLVAKITSSTDPIAFKHAGAAVQLTINNLVSGTYKTKLSVAGKQITGNFHVNPANAGSESLALDAAENTSLNTVTLNTWKSSGAFTWIFPVPTLTTPKLTFEILDNNGISVWSKTPKTQSSLGRGDILVMPALSVSAYKQFDTNAGWGVCGTHNSWSGDTKMVTDGKLCIAKGIEFAANAEFKVRTVGNWGDAGKDNFGYSYVNTGKSKNVVDNGGNIKVTTAGTYDVIFNSSDSEYYGYGAKEIRVVLSSFPYPLPKETADITIDGTFTDWEGITPESAGNASVKVVSDNTKLSFYVQLTNVASTNWGAGKYLYVLFDLDGDPSNDVSQWGNKGDFIMLIYPYGGSSESPALVTSPTGDWLCNPSTPYTISNVSLNGALSAADGSGNRTVTYEFSIPRADIPTIPSTDPITLTFKGSPLTSNVSISRKL